MPDLLWIVLTTLTISLLAWVGLFYLLLHKKTLQTIMPALVAFAAGTLLGGAFLHLLLESVSIQGPRLSIFVWVLIGFGLFFAIEQYLQFHHHYFPGHHHSEHHPKKPVTYMILLADGLHNFIGGLAIGSSFLVGTQTGLITAFAAAAHEIPQELGDFGILVQGGWGRKRALQWNFYSALTIIPGGLLAYGLSGNVDTVFLLPFSAGNFIYIAAADLIPEIKHETNLKKGAIQLALFSLGILLLLAIKIIAH